MVEQVATKSKPDSESLDVGPLPTIAITVGDVAGIGPELALRCAADDEIRSFCQPLLVGPVQVIRHIAGQLPRDSAGTRNLVQYVDDHAKDWIDIGKISVNEVVAGHFTAATGQASYDAVVWAIDAAMQKRVEAIVTGPIQKEAWYAAGIRYPGHTELLAEKTSTSNFRMMLSAPEISCVLVTIHIPLADVARSLTVHDIVESIELAAGAFRRRAEGDVRVTVCGLNPHAGENGLFSHGEERDVITPAIAAARRPGIKITGPVPPDTAFTPAMRQRTDVYVCMYHDQGLIPLKALAFDEAVNVTLGLPIVRTSVDHGTALDIAWQGVATHASMIAAIKMAIGMCG